MQSSPAVVISLAAQLLVLYPSSLTVKYVRVPAERERERNSQIEGSLSVEGWEVLEWNVGHSSFPPSSYGVLGRQRGRHLRTQVDGQITRGSALSLLSFKAFVSGARKREG